MMTLAPTLETDRLTLRGPTVQDLGVYSTFYAATEVRVGKYRGGRTLAKVQSILAEDIDHWQAKGFGMWLLETQQDNRIVGGCGIVHPDDWPHHELTFWLMPDQQGKGYATEASRAVLDFGYNTLGWPVVETHIRDENEPARRLVNRLGGRKIRRELFPDGVTRDIFALSAPLTSIRSRTA